jgi:hypothetical protein
MRMNWQKFLAMGALCALGATSACMVEVVEGPPEGAGGTAGSAGSAGTGGTKGDAATSEAGTPDGAAGGALGADANGSDVLVTDATAEPMTSDATTEVGTSDVVTSAEASSDAPDASADRLVDAVTADNASLDSPTDAGDACFAEDQPDAGRATTCASLPYYATMCADDAGDHFPPAGAALCDTLDPDLKNSAYEALFACLAALPGADGGSDACSAAHEQASAECSRNLFNRTMCPVADGTAEGGVYGCTQIAASCGPDSGDGGISVEQCRGWLGPFNAAARQDIIDCYLDPADVGATSCRNKFEDHCVFR